MVNETMALAVCVGLSWAMIMVATTLGGKLWTPKGVMWASGNRQEPNAPSALAGRAQRAAANMLENMILFTALVVAVRFSEANNATSALGATVFMWARVMYWPVYLVGIPYLRTGVWFVGVVGMFMMGSALM